MKQTTVIAAPDSWHDAAVQICLALEEGKNIEVVTVMEPSMDCAALSAFLDMLRGEEARTGVSFPVRVSHGGERGGTTFSRNATLFSPGEQAALWKARAAICGCGGVGGYVADILARTGVGHLDLFDPDSFEESNRNRQLMCGASTLGRKKAEVLRDYLMDAAPYARVEAHPVRADDGAAEMLAAADIIVDCADNLNKIAVLRVAKRLRKMYVTGGVRGLNWHVGAFRDAAEVCGLYERPRELVRGPQCDTATQGMCAGFLARSCIDLILHRNSPGMNGITMYDAAPHQLFMRTTPASPAL